MLTNRKYIELRLEEKILGILKRIDTWKLKLKELKQNESQIDNLTNEYLEILDSVDNLNDQDREDISKLEEFAFKNGIKLLGQDFSHYIDTRKVLDIIQIFKLESLNSIDREKVSELKKESEDLNAKIHEAYIKIDYLKGEVYFPIVKDLLGLEFQAAYLCPADAPSIFGPRRIGHWKYIDKMDFSSINWDSFLNTNPNSEYIQFNLKDRQFTSELQKESFDLMFINKDWTEDGSSYFMANSLLRKQGLLSILNSIPSKEFKKLYPNYIDIFNPDFDGYTILMKE